MPFTDTSGVAAPRDNREVDHGCRRMASGPIGYRDRHHRAGSRCRRVPAALLMDAAMASMFVDMARRRDQLLADLAAFRTAHASQKIDDLSREETSELFSLLLANHRLDR